MHKLAAALFLTISMSSAAWAQVDIRNPTINTASAEGALITQAGMAEDPDEKLKLLETFAEKFSGHSAIGYVYLQLQGLYLPKNNFDRVIEYGKKLLAIVPGDVEVSHNLTKAYEGKQDWAALLPHLIETKPAAEKDVVTAEPEYEDEVAAWQAKIDYAKGVVQYIEYSLYTSALKIADPQTKINYMNALREQYADGQYAKQTVDYYIQAYQQLGDFENMLAEMEKAVAANPAQESYLYTLAESSLRQNNHDKAKAFAEQLVQVMSQKPKPENQTDEAWEKHKALFTAYGNLVLGKSLVSQAGETKQMYRDGRTLLLTAVEPLKEQGGETYGALAYFLGICYVKLDVEGDNIAAATRWMGEAAKTQSPYQGEAKKTLAAIRASQ